MTFASTPPPAEVMDGTIFSLLFFCLSFVTVKGRRLPGRQKHLVSILIAFTRWSDAGAGPSYVPEPGPLEAGPAWGRVMCADSKPPPEEGHPSLHPDLKSFLHYTHRSSAKIH